MKLLKELKYYLSGQSQIQINKGRRICQTAFPAIDIEQNGEEDYTIYIPSESSDNIYQVDLFYDENEKLMMICECPAYEDFLDCKHCVAAVMALQKDLAEAIQKTPATLPQQNQASFQLDKEGYFHFKMDAIRIFSLNTLSGNSYQNAPYVIASGIRSLTPNLPHQKFIYDEKSKQIADIDIVYDGGNGFKTRCSCGDISSPICKHVIGSFIFLEQQYNSYFFNRFKDFTDEKNQILSAYGITINDPEAKEFEWYLSSWGQLQLKSRPASFVAAGSMQFLQDIKKQILGNTETHFDASRPPLPASTVLDFEIGFLFNFGSVKHIGFELEGLFIRYKKGKTDIKKLSIHNESNLPFLQSVSDHLFEQLTALSDRKLIEWMSQNGCSYLKSYVNPWNQLLEKDIPKLKDHYFELLQDLWPSLCDEPHLYELNESRLSQANVKPVILSKTPALLRFKVMANDRLITIKIGAYPEGTDAQETTISALKNEFILKIDNTLYLPKNSEDLSMLDNFYTGELKFPLSERLEVIRNIILPLQTKYQVTIDQRLDFEIDTPVPSPHLLLEEQGDTFLVLKPRFQYENITLDYEENLEYVKQREGTIKLIKRDKSKEKKFYEFLRFLHPKFSAQRNGSYYTLPFKEVMKDAWFLSMIQQVQDAGYPIYGLQDLKNFRYNTNKPTFEIKASNGIDWFDLKIEITWGDQQVTLKDIRKAILNRQEAVLLDDGTLGIIPSEWIDQYSLLLKIGTDKDDHLQLSKLHYSILDQLDGKLNNKKVELEIADKKKKLQSYTGTQNYLPLSAAINAQLRPYQLTGVQWMQALDDLGWGGCLADDMGLGKTLQAITFLQYLKEKDSAGTQLIICPTSLIFNWENELDKFCPALKYHTYYGNQRSFDVEHFEKFDIILTTYGTLRLDIGHLSQFNWNYIILDESQAIKNPEAQVTKSLSLLKAKNRLIMSGTPVQNNTMDLFAQFNFINPGFLGNKEFFKREFADPIDKYGDKLKSEQLRRMVYPFMLRRTKEQVATDLPDKTETVIWCTMGKAQRSVYDEYKNYYRNLLLKKIDEEGIGKSGIYVLEGLLRLRQICDHPLLIKDSLEMINDSVKTEELMREIQENSGGHKLLVFSQFTEMLQLIGKELELAGIAYCYLDGSTPAAKRKIEVERFQQDETIQVFLISLKAGGVGLNLTAADYVYLVDPWWNPAAEQQAIDRTHRIGQTRKIFAYKMICKDTVEEKILKLQEKKKSLADDLINEDSSFLKKLTKDDVAFLFS